MHGQPLRRWKNFTLHPSKPNRVSFPEQSALQFQRETVAAALTSLQASGAIGVIGVHGADAYQAVARCFRPATAFSQRPFTLNEIRFGHWRSNESIVVLPAGDETIEIHCHGGSAAIQSILADLRSEGVRITDANRWNIHLGKNSERVAMEFVLAQTNTACTAKIALDQCNGALAQWARRTISSMTEIDGVTSLQAIREEISGILRFKKLGEHLIEPWHVVIAGPPNVGKSSLLNRLLGYERAISHDQPGTTRDIISATTAIAGWPVRFSDTAGVRSAIDPLEQMGVQRALGSLSSADLVLLVVDSSVGWEPAHQQLKDQHLQDEMATPYILLWNKCDLASEVSHADLSHPNSLAVSATTGIGLQHVAEQIVQSLVPDMPPPGFPVPITQLQSETLQQALLAESVEGCRELLCQLIY